MGRFGPDVAFRIADGDNKAFVSIGTDGQSGAYGFMSSNKPFTNTDNVDSDATTYARRSTPNTVVINMDRTKFGITNGPVNPVLTVESAVFDESLNGGQMHAEQVCAG